MKDVSDSTKTQCLNLLLADLTLYNIFLRSQHKHADAAWASSDNGDKQPHVYHFTQDIKFVDSDVRARRVWRSKHDPAITAASQGMRHKYLQDLCVGCVRPSGTGAEITRHFHCQNSGSVCRSLSQWGEACSKESRGRSWIGNHNRHQITPYHSTVSNMLKLAWLSCRQASLPSPYFVTSHSLSTA